MRWFTFLGVPVLAIGLALLNSGAPEPPARPIRPSIDARHETIPGFPARSTSARNAAVTEERAASKPTADEARIDIGKDGGLRFRGLPVTEASLVGALARFAGEDRDGNGSSRKAVRVVAEPETPWRHVRRALSDCTRPEIRITRLRLTVGERTESIAVGGRPARPRLISRVRSSRFGRRPELRLKSPPWGYGRHGLDRLPERLELHLELIKPAHEGEIRADGGTPAALVARVLGIYREAGVPATHLTGVPPRHWATVHFLRRLEDGDDERLEARMRALFAGEGVEHGCEVLVEFFAWEGRLWCERALPVLIPFANREAAAKSGTPTPAIALLAGLRYEASLEALRVLADTQSVAPGSASCSSAWPRTHGNRPRTASSPAGISND